MIFFRTKSRFLARQICGFIVLMIALMVTVRGQSVAAHCAQCATWNTPQVPFRVYGNTWYVGPHGLSSILISGPRGHILIDGDLPQSASLIAANIQSLGFRIRDVKLIVNSHVHFDHAGGIAELQRLSGAEVVASAWSAAVMSKGGAGRGDPQYAGSQGIARVAHVRILRDGQALRVGGVEITAHSTPGHTPGGTSWTWKSCEKSRCRNMVFADSLTPVSSAGFKFTGSRNYPGAIADFEKSFVFLESVPCDLLMTTHPDVSDFWTRVDAHRRSATPDPLIDPTGCRRLASESRASLRARIAVEKGH
jgi:metallo-beta-lactamase class B